MNFSAQYIEPCTLTFTAAVAMATLGRYWFTFPVVSFPDHCLWRVEPGYETKLRNMPKVWQLCNIILFMINLSWISYNDTCEFRP